MVDRSQEIADSFMRHWGAFSSDSSATRAQCELARRLIYRSYPIPVPLTEFLATATTPPPPKPPPHARRLEEYSWTPVNPELSEWLVQNISPVDGKYKVTESAQIAVSTVDWYGNWYLLQVADPQWPNPKLHVYYLLNSSQHLFRLNGTSSPIHEANELAPIHLTSENVLSYLVFFTFFVRGEEGPFHCIEFLDDPLIAEIMSADEENPDLLSARAAVEATIRPLTLEEIDDQGRYLCDGVVFYSNAIFAANFAVQPDGMVEMLDDEPIAADLPYKLDAPIT